MNINAPLLETAPTIDGDLAEWKDLAHNDGIWGHAPHQRGQLLSPRSRRAQPPHRPRRRAASRRRLARHATTLLGDAQNFYFGAEVWDNVNDLDDPDPADKRWYFKDAICWFMEGPRDRANERFGQGDNAFCFVADPQRTPQNAWWRHGAPGQSYIEEPIPEAACDYVRAHGSLGPERG